MHIFRSAEMVRWCLAISFVSWFAAGSVSHADEIRYVNEDGQEVELQARLVGTGRGFQAFERNDGQIRIVPSAAVVDRENSDGPAPLTADEMAQRLREIFTTPLTRIEIQKSVVVAMVLAAPLDKAAEGHAQTFLKKAVRFMTNVDGVFQKYADFMHFPTRDLKFPLVLIIFESDQDFEKYADEATGGRALSARSITGFYSGLTNWLAVRMSACDSFEVPLHEAIHQQMYNRVLQRLAPIPKWFDEGIATGFEGNGERIDSNPSKVNTHYARLAMRLGNRVNWNELVADDSAFSADVLAGDAYTLAWCLHWMLATGQKEEYRQYVNELSRREPLSKLTPEEESARFATTFGLNMSELQGRFSQALQLAAKRQKVILTDPPAGNITSQQALGQYSVDAVSISNLGGQMQVSGALKNISPLRPMTYYVTVETDGGLYADWLVPDLKPAQQQPLPRQVVAKPITGQASGTSRQYRVYVRSVPASSEQAAAWKNGQVPGPMSAASE